MATGFARRVRWQNWVLPLLGGTVVGLALWARSPAVPNIALQRGAGTGKKAAAAAAADLRQRTERMLADLHSATTAALAAPAEPTAGFAALRGLSGESPERGIILFERDRPVQWAGRLRVPLDTVTAPVSVITTPLYTVVAVTSSEGERRAVAAAVLHASPPADRLASALDAIVTGGHSIAGFVLYPGGGPGTPVVVGPDGSVMLRAEAVPLSLAEMGLVSAARLRARIAIACGLLLIAFLGISAHRGNRAERLAALAVALLVLGIIPFNAFSRTTRVFDPSYYYTPAGGPWTANVGVFLLSSIVLTLAMLAVVRGRALVRARWIAVLSGVLIAVAGFLVVRELAVGIGQPALGATVQLWLAWQAPLFLAALSFLIPIAWVIDTGLRRRRRLTRRSFLAASVAASILAASLVWLTTVGQRIQLAERDVAALHEGRDEYLDALLLRLGQSLEVAAPPANRVDLLRVYAESELAIAGYTLALGRWDGAGGYIEGLDLTFGIPDRTLAQPIVGEALRLGSTVITRAPGPVGVVWIAAVPHANGGATSIVALPRSRIAPPSPSAMLLGIPSPMALEPAYSVTLAEGVAPPLEQGLLWRRMGSELHADAPLQTSAGPARAHIEIDLRSLEALGQRLFLVVLFNLAIAGLLLLMVRASERGFGRRTRVRFRHWAGSFRSRLTVALFAFFFIPAAAFTVWGYGRLAAENRQLRRLVVRETLHAASVAREAETLPTIATRLRTPLLAYENGLVSSTSDTLIEVLAPLGLALPPPVHLHLALSGELTATWEEDVGGASVLLGYRNVAAPAAQAVIAAPARGSDELMTRRARDISVLLLFATAVGALAALWLSGVAAHQFGRPIAALRRAARAVARGDRRPPELPSAPSEFEPVFTAFRRMSADLERSRIELARAERVLAWGEMARQVAHEIKNPLTPMRLGVQYLQRARGDQRVDFDAVFQENSERILREIDRLDEIARAFSRYGSAPTDLPPAEPVDIAAVVRDLVAFEQMGAGDVEWVLSGAGEPCWGVARREEFREVLMNVFENARTARASRVLTTLRCPEAEAHADAGVTITVEDDGMGITRDVLPRIFEPHFSTRTTGSGLGLAISRRLLDAWGGTIRIESEPGRGTSVTIVLQPAPGG